MHEAVFEAGWQQQELMKEHRNKIGAIHSGKGKEIIARLLDVFLSSL